MLGGAVGELVLVESYESFTKGRFYWYMGEGIIERVLFLNYKEETFNCHLGEGEETRGRYERVK